MKTSCKFGERSGCSFPLRALRPKISSKITSVRYFGSLWMTFNEELQGQISACLQRTNIYVLYIPAIGLLSVYENWVKM